MKTSIFSQIFPNGFKVKGNVDLFSGCTSFNEIAKIAEQLAEKELAEKAAEKAAEKSAEKDHED